MSVPITYVGRRKFSTYLTRPQRNKGTEGVPSLNLSPAHLLESSTEGSREGAVGAGLDLDLGHLEGAKGNIGEDLSGGGTGEPDGGLVLVGELLTSQVHVGILEDLIEAVLEHALEGVADKGRAETFPDTVGTLLSDEGLKGTAEGVVLAGVHLFQCC